MRSESSHSTEESHQMEPIDALRFEANHIPKETERMRQANETKDFWKRMINTIRGK